MLVSRSEYLEHGSNICRRKFGQAIWQPSAKAEDEAVEALEDARDADKDRGKGKHGRTRLVKSGEKEGAVARRASRSFKKGTPVG